MINEIKEKLTALATEFKALKAEGKFDESNAKFEEFKALENELEAAKLAQANETALENKASVLNIEKNQSKTSEE